MKSFKIWTESEMDELRALFPNTPNKELATKFNCTLYVIRNIACKNGLKKSQAYMEDYLKNKAHQHLPKYKKGQTSWCKGTKGVMTNGVETRFKKGQIPHNIKPIGHLSTCKGYITIKTEEGYKKLHRVIWEQHNGKIPPLKLVIFKDGNNRNFDIDNLELVEKVHHMLKNHPMKYPQDIKEAINIKREIIKYINKHGKKQD